jgi:hypothetical protein
VHNVNHQLKEESAMTSEKWSVLKAWFYANHKTLPKDVEGAIGMLLDEHESEDDQWDGTTCVECGAELVGEELDYTTCSDCRPDEGDE